MPVLTRALLCYRFRRLDEARRAAREAGLRGAMFPWMSGSSGREETQRIHLNPQSGRWIADNTRRQRHIGAAICYNIWEYVEATGDRGFLRDFGAELLFEIARFWSSLAHRRPDGRYGIRGVMGPDEFHTAYPGADPQTAGGIDNNAYTNLMVSWLLARAFDVLDLIPSDQRRRLCEKLKVTDDELERWDEISRKLFIPVQEDGIIAQFEGYEKLEEFTQEQLTVSSRVLTAHPITVAYRGQSREMSPGQSFVFVLVPETKPDRTVREREQRRIREKRVPTERKDSAA